MQFIPATKEEEKQLLRASGATDFSELIHIIPKHLQINYNLGIGEPLSEMEIYKEIMLLSNNNSSEDIFLIKRGHVLANWDVDQLKFFLI